MKKIKQIKSLIFTLAVIIVLSIASITSATWIQYYAPPSVNKTIKLVDGTGPKRVNKLKARYRTNLGVGNNQKGFLLTWQKSNDTTYPGVAINTAINKVRVFLIYRNINDTKVTSPSTIVDRNYQLSPPTRTTIKKLAYTLLNSTFISGLDTDYSYSDISTAIIDGSKYIYKVVAVDIYGNLGDPSYTNQTNDGEISDLYTPPLPINTVIAKAKPFGSSIELSWNVPTTNAYSNMNWSEYETSYKYEVYGRISPNIGAGGTFKKKLGYDTAVLKEYNWVSGEAGQLINEGSGSKGILTYKNRGLGGRVIATFVPSRTYLQGWDTSGLYWSFAVKALRKNMVSYIPSAIPTLGPGMGNQIPNPGFEVFGGSTYGWNLTGTAALVNTIKNGNNGPTAADYRNISSYFGLGLFKVQNRSEVSMKIPVNAGTAYESTVWYHYGSVAKVSVKWAQYNTANILITPVDTTQIVSAGFTDSNGSTYATGRYRRAKTPITTNANADYLMISTYSALECNCALDQFIFRAKYTTYPTIQLIKDNTKPLPITKFLLKTTYNSQGVELHWTLPTPKDLPYEDFYKGVNIYINSTIFNDSNKPAPYIINLPANRLHPWDGSSGDTDSTWILDKDHDGSVIAGVGQVYYLGVACVDYSGNVAPISSVYRIKVGRPNDTVRPEPVYLKAQPKFINGLTSKITTVTWDVAKDYDNFGQELISGLKYYVYRRRGYRVGNRLENPGFENGNIGWQLSDGSVLGEIGNDTKLSGLTAYWKFDESSGTDAWDSSSGGLYKGTLTGSITRVVGAFSGKALSFSATSNQYVGTSYKFPTYANGVTLEAWVKIPSTSTTAGYILSNGGGSGGTTASVGVDLYLGSDGKLYVNGGKGSGTANFALKASDTVIRDGKWRHIAMTWDGSTTSGAVKTYIDGVATNTGNASVAGTTIGTASYNFRIGNWANGTANGVVGIIDQVAVYSKVLTVTDISRRYRIAANSIYNFYGTKSLAVSGSSIVYNSTRTRVLLDTTGLKGKYFDTARVSAQVFNASSSITDYPKLTMKLLGAFETSSEILGYWNFNGSGNTVNDRSKDKNNGTLNNFTGTPWGMYTYGIDTKYNALLFNNLDLNDFVSIPDPGANSIFDLTKVVTMEAWVYIDSYQAGDTYHFVVGKTDTGTARSYGMWVRSNNTILLSYNNGGGIDMFSNATFTIGAWHHLVAIIDTVANYRAIYLDNVRVGVDNTTDIPSLPVNNSNIYVGSVAASWSLKGKIAGAAIYNKQLSVAEIAANYNGARVMNKGGYFTIEKIFSNTPPAPTWYSIVLGTKLPVKTNYLVDIGLTTSGATTAKMYYDNISVDNGIPKTKTTGKVGYDYDTLSPPSTSNPSNGTTIDDNKFLNNELYYYAVRAEDKAEDPWGSNFGYFGIGVDPDKDGNLDFPDYVFTDTLAPILKAAYLWRPNYWKYAGSNLPIAWSATTTSFGYYAYLYDTTSGNTLYTKYDSALPNGTTPLVRNLNETKNDSKQETMHGSISSPTTVQQGGVGNKYKWGDNLRLEITVDKSEPEAPFVIADLSSFNSLSPGDSGQVSQFKTDGRNANGDYIYTIKKPIVKVIGKVDYPRSDITALWPDKAPNTAKGMRGYAVKIQLVDGGGNVTNGGRLDGGWYNPNPLYWDSSFSLMLDNTPDGWKWAQYNTTSVWGKQATVKACWLFDAKDIYDSTRDLKATVNGKVMNGGIIALEKTGSLITSLQLDDVNDRYVDFGTSNLLGGYSEATWEAKIYIRATSGWDTREQVIVSSYNDAATGTPMPRSWKFSVNGTGLRLDLRAGTDTVNTNPKFETTTNQGYIVPNEWHHVAVTYKSTGASNGQVKFYVNGTLIYTGSSTGNITGNILNKNTVDKILVGASKNDGTVNNFFGHIDEVLIYRRALSSTEIRNRWRKIYLRPKTKR